jgi:peroxiredoxin
MFSAGGSSPTPANLWPLMHLFYRIDFGAWSILSPEEQIAAKTHLSELVQQIRAHREVSLHVFGMLTPKADVGFLVSAPDIHDVHAFEKRITQALGPDILVPAYSFLSLLTPRTDRISSAHSPEEADALCFFPVGAGSVDFRGGSARPERLTSERLWDAIRESTPEEEQTVVWVSAAGGLEEAEWGITVFAPGLVEISAWMARFRGRDSLRDAEVGDCHVGLALSLDALFRRVQI